MRNRPLGFETLEDRRLLANVWPHGVGTVDAIIDGAYGLSHSVPPYAFEEYGIEHEDVRTSKASATRAAFIGSASDTNGKFFYPDGQLRALVVVVHGGSATKHGKALGDAGQEAFERFYEAGGSYVGSCAGLWFARDGKNYANLWDGGTVKNSGHTGYQTVSFAGFEGPFSAYLDRFGVPDVVKSIRHICGPKVDEAWDNPPGTVFYGQITSGVARGTNYFVTYQTATSGMMGAFPGHPEYAASGDRMHLYAAGLTYAIENSRVVPQVIGDLTAGAPVSAIVGDGQYHRYSTNVPAGLASFTITTSAQSGTEIYLTHDGVAYDGGSDYSGDSITVTAPQAGKWEVSVLGTHDVANGMAYTMTVDAVRDDPIFNGLGEGEMSETEKRLATAAELMASRPDHIDWDVVAWAGATVRLVRLDGPAKLRAALAAEKIDQDDRESFYAFGVDLLADSIVDDAGVKQFAEEAAKRWLSGEIGAVGELVPIAIDLNGLGADAVAGEVEAAGKN